MLAMIFSLAMFFQGGAGSLFTGILPILLVFAVFYFLVIMPQRKRQQQLQQLISSLKPGDRIVTSGGIIGVVMTVKDDSVTIKSADKSILEIARSSIAGKDVEDVKEK